MLKKLMSKNLNILTYFSSGVSILSLFLTIEDKHLKNEITKNKVEYFRKSLEEVQTKILTEVETIQNLENQNIEQKEILNSHLNNINKEHENMHQTIQEILKYFNDDNNKFLGDNIIEIWKNFINNWSAFISNLTFEQLISVAHLTSSICILFNILTILSILFGDKLINYFKLEERFPKLSFIFKIRRKFNNFSLTLSFIMIITILLALIYVNFRILTL
jgi:hypothetical protein